MQKLHFENFFGDVICVKASFNFMVTVTVYSDFRAQENKVCHCFHFFSTYLLWSDGTRWNNFVFLIVSFKPAFLLSSFTFIKRLFSSSSISAIRAVSSVYLKLFIFLPAILIPVCASFSPAFPNPYLSLTTLNFCHAK